MAGISQSHALGVGGFQSNESNQQDHSGKRGPVGNNAHGSDILDATTHSMRLEKSNILLLGPTGSGKFSLNKIQISITNH